MSWRSTFSNAIPLLALAALWQAASMSGLVNPDFLPSLQRIARATADLFTNENLLGDLRATVVSAGVGVVVGCALGIPLGAGMALSQRFEAILDPVIKSTYSLPKTALVPLLILWMGIGGLTNILTVAFACLLPIIIYTYHGVQGVPRTTVWSARAMGTPAHLMIWRIYIPSALHAILVGVRLAVSLAFVLAVATEMIVANAGLGKAMFLYGENGAYDYMFGAVLVTVLAAFLADRLTVLIGNHLLRWADPQQRLG